MIPFYYYVNHLVLNSPKNITNIDIYNINSNHYHNILNIYLFVYLFTSFCFLIILYFALYPYFVTNLVSLRTLESALLISLSLSLTHIILNYAFSKGCGFNIFASKIHLPAVQHVLPMFPHISKLNHCHKVYHIFGWTIL